MKKRERDRLIKVLAEWCVDDALAMAEAFPGKKRPRLGRAYYSEELGKSKPRKSSRSPSRKKHNS